MEQIQQFKNSETESLKARFSKAASSLQEHGRKSGIRITPWVNENLPLFSKLSLEKQWTCLNKIEFNKRVFDSIENSSTSLPNTNTVVWKVCSELGCRPPSDFFAGLTNEDVIQIYSEDGVHRFANLNFYEICSYTLEQILCLEWDRLWKRDPIQLERLIQVMHQILRPEQRERIVFNDEPHLVWELESPLRYETHYRLRHAAPLFCRKSGRKVGFIVAEQVKLTNPLSPDEEERRLSEFALRHAPSNSSCDVPFI